MDVMNNLLSGLIGAVIASFLSVIYLSFSDGLQRRRNLYLEVVKYIDDIIANLYAIFAFNYEKYAQKKSPFYDAGGLTQANIQEFSRGVSHKLLSHGIRSQVAIVYGEGRSLADLAKFFELALEINGRLSGLTQAIWIRDNGKDIYDFFDKKIDPERLRLQESFKREASFWGVIKSYFSIKENLGMVSAMAGNISNEKAVELWINHSNFFWQQIRLLPIIEAIILAGAYQPFIAGRIKLAVAILAFGTLLLMVFFFILHRHRQHIRILRELAGGLLPKPEAPILRIKSDTLAISIPILLVIFNFLLFVLVHCFGA